VGSSCFYLFTISANSLSCSIVDEEDGKVVASQDVDFKSLRIPEHARFNILSVKDERRSASGLPFEVREVIVQYEANLFNHLFTLLGRHLCLKIDLQDINPPIVSYFVDGKVILLHQMSRGYNIEVSDLFKLAKPYPKYRITDFEVLYGMPRYSDIMNNLEKFGSCGARELTVTKSG
jgi:hypothetical protein